MLSDGETRTDAEAEWIGTLARDLRRQMPDKASARATTGRLRNLHRRSGLTRDAFLDAVYEARNRTRKRAGLRSPMPYFFATLADVLHPDDRPAIARATRPKPISTATPPVPRVISQDAPLCADQDETWTALRAMGIPDAATFKARFGILPGQVPGALGNSWRKLEYARARLAERTRSQ